MFIKNLGLIILSIKTVFAIAIILITIDLILKTSAIIILTLVFLQVLEILYSNFHVYLTFNFNNDISVINQLIKLTNFYFIKFFYPSTK